MKRLTKTLVALLSLFACFLPVTGLVGAVLLTPPVYSDTFYGALDEKFERLNSIEEDKIVVVGGSSVAFGLDSALMERELGMPVVNFGLYAAIGTKAMLDLSRSGIKEGDIVILAPELDTQTLSMYFSGKNMIMALDDDYSMLRYIRGDDRLSLIGSLFEHAQNKINYIKNGSPSPAGIYNIDSFNEYGDIKAGLRDENIMPLYYSPSGMITLEPEILADDFAEYINEYIAFCESRGATVYYSFPPMNELAVEDSSPEVLTEFTNHLKSKINCEFISVIDSYIMDAGYFYDTNYHLNDTGVAYRTRQLAEDISLYIGAGAIDIDVPPPPPLPELDFSYFGYDENEIYFTYDTLPNGAMVITGVSDLGRGMESLTVPLGVNGVKITHIGEGAFRGTALKTLIVTENTNLRQFLDGAFDGSSVEDLWIYYDFGANEEEKLSPASSFGRVTVHFPPGSAYLTHYDWNDSSSGYIKKFDAIK